MSVRRVVTTLTSFGLGLAVGLGVTTLASATNFGSTACGGTPRNCVSLADNASHYWYPEGTFGNQISGINSAFTQSMNDYEYWTDLTTTRQNNSTLDVLVTDFDYGLNGLNGWVECLPGSATSGSHPNLRCDRQKLRLNGTYVDGFNATQLRSLSCHEIGHTVGLRHTSNTSSCLSPWTSTRSALTSSHDDAHVNAAY